MVRARAGEINLPPIAGMAFGTGGVDASGTPIIPSVSDMGLKMKYFGKRLTAIHLQMILRVVIFVHYLFLNVQMRILVKLVYMTQREIL